MNTNTSRIDEIHEGAPSIGQDMRALQDVELDAVNGGLVVNAIIAILIGELIDYPCCTSSK